MAILNVQGVLLTGVVPADGSPPLAPYAQELAWPAGEDGSIALAVVDPLGAAVNIAGWTVTLAARLLQNDAAPEIKINGTLVSGGAGGLATFAIPAAATSALPVDIYRYEIWGKDGSNTRHRLVPSSNFSLLAADLLVGEGP
jgi:hypothetical protein